MNVAGDHPALRLTVVSSADNIAVARQAAAGFADDLGASPDVIDDIRTAVSEAVTNCVVHAYPEGSGPIELDAHHDTDSLQIVVRDHGTGVQPRPATGNEDSLRVGLALIGALSDGLEIKSERGEGTEVRISFNLDPSESDGGGAEDVEIAIGPDMTTLAIGSAQPGGAIASVLELLAARANLDVERVSDVVLVADLLSEWNSEAAVDGQPLRLAARERDASLEVRIGPLEPGLAEKLVGRGKLPGVGDTLSTIVDRLAIEQAGLDESPGEYLVLEVEAAA